MDSNAQDRTREFLKVAPQFQLGGLVTEGSHPVTAELSQTARSSTAAALRMLFEVDRDVVERFGRAVETGEIEALGKRIYQAAHSGHKLFFTGCGSTGRLSIQLVSIWRKFWASRGRADLENLAFSVMAGGDFALIKSVEGFEDFTAFGRRQIADLGVGRGDLTFAITEGGETSFVIGTAWEALEKGSEVVFVYNNPDEILRKTVERSREVVDEPRIRKVNLTTGNMAITGSTRMQATTIQLLVLSTAMELACRRLLGMETDEVADVALEQFEKGLDRAQTEAFTTDLARLVELEESFYRAGRQNTYFADALAVDVLTDTTERSPTFCTPPFRKFDDRTSDVSWAFLFVPQDETPAAWRALLGRDPSCVNWSPTEVEAMIGSEKAPRASEVISRIGTKELMRFRIGRDGRESRPISHEDGITLVLAPQELGEFTAGSHPFAEVLAGTDSQKGVLAFGATEDLLEAQKAARGAKWAGLEIPKSDLLLQGPTRAIVKIVLNALSTCTMVRLGRVMGNTMVWVAPTNLKLIDRSTRYVSRLTGLDYETACLRVHEALEYVGPRMSLDRAYPPVVALCVEAHETGKDFTQAEESLRERIGGF